MKDFSKWLGPDDPHETIYYDFSQKNITSINCNFSYAGFFSLLGYLAFNIYSRHFGLDIFNVDNNDR